MCNVIIKPVRGHLEVFVNGSFLFSADTYREAKEELDERYPVVYTRGSSGAA